MPLACDLLSISPQRILRTDKVIRLTIPKRVCPFCRLNVVVFFSASEAGEVAKGVLLTGEKRRRA